MSCVMIMNYCICWVICIIWPWPHQPIQKNRCIYFSAFESSSTPLLFNFEIIYDDNSHFQFGNFQHNYWKFQLGTGSCQQWLISSSSFQSQQSVNLLFMHFPNTNLQIQILNFVFTKIYQRIPTVYYMRYIIKLTIRWWWSNAQMSMLSQSYQTYSLAPP